MQPIVNPNDWEENAIETTPIVLKQQVQGRILKNLQSYEHEDMHSLKYVQHVPKMNKDNKHQGFLQKNFVNDAMNMIQNRLNMEKPQYWKVVQTNLGGTLNNLSLKYLTHNIDDGEL